MAHVCATPGWAACNFARTSDANAQGIRRVFTQSGYKQTTTRDRKLATFITSRIGHRAQHFKFASIRISTTLNPFPRLVVVIVDDVVKIGWLAVRGLS